MPTLAPRIPKRRTEATVQAEVRLALNRLEGVTVWRNARGYDEERKVTYGLAPGAADLVGVMTVSVYQRAGLSSPPLGVAIFVELKNPRRGSLEPDQVTFREVVLKLGAVHVVARSADEAVEQVTMARHRIEGGVFRG
jgi:hypothetical protein